MGPSAQDLELPAAGVVVIMNGGGGTKKVKTMDSIPSKRDALRVADILEKVCPDRRGARSSRVSQI